MADQRTQFRRRLVEALTGNPSSFDFSYLVWVSGVPRKTADAVADQMLSQLYAKSANDRVITEKEQAKLNRLAGLLEISTSRQQAICRRAAQKSMRKAISEARSDGVITQEERLLLQQLRHALGLRKIDVTEAVQARPSASKAVPVPLRPAAPTGTFVEACFRQSLCYSVSDSVDAVLSNIDELRSLDALSERKALIWSGILTVSGIALFLAVPLAFFGLFTTQMSNTRPYLLWGAGVVGGSGLVGVVVSLIFSKKHGRLDIEDRRYECVAGILRLIRGDLNREDRISVSADFRPYDEADKYMCSGTVGPWSVDYFAERWLELQGRFADGTKFLVGMVEKRQDRHRTKRSLSGKLKHKYKAKTSSEVILRLTIKEKKYPTAQELFDLIEGAVKLPSWVTLKSVNAEGNRMTLRVATAARWSVKGVERRHTEQDVVDLVAMMFLSLYQLLNEARGKKSKESN